MSGSIPQPFIDDLLERVDIVEVIDSRVKLKKTGKNYSACCPFHDEKTPSFSVSPDKQFYYCFGCGASGNSIGFIMDYERLSFPESVESLAKTAGLTVPREQHRDPKKRAQEDAREKARKTLYSLMESANDFYQQQLREHNDKATAIDYLKRRGLSGHIAKEFGIGYAPSGWDNLSKHLGTSNTLQDLLVEGGMLIHNEDKQRRYDRFRERIMFPIRDTRGRVIGFGGRVLGDEKPKYLNSPETPIFHKGKELYGLYEARQAYRQLPRLLVVEGYMDVVALAQFGIRYGVATLGTACGIDHLQRAFRFTNEVVFCFDGDNAGRKAARRAMENALPTMEDGRQIKFLYLPEGEDPDTLVRQLGEEKFTRLIEAASPLEQFLFEELSQDIDTQTMEGRARLCKLAAPLIDQLPRGVYRELMFQQLASRTQLSIDALMTLLSELPQDTAPEVDKPKDHNEPYPQIAAEPSTTDSYPTHHHESDTYHSEEHAYTNHEQTSHHTTQLSKPKTQASHLSADEHALALLLYSPKLAQHINNTEELQHSKQDNIALLVNLIALLQQRPEFTTGQILGHWQGTYGADSANALQALATKAALFHQARELSANNDEKLQFNPQQEFVDALQHLQQQQQQKDCQSLIKQLESKPYSDWSDTDKQLYSKAIKARAKQI